MLLERGAHLISKHGVAPTPNLPNNCGNDLNGNHVRQWHSNDLNSNNVRQWHSNDLNSRCNSKRRNNNRNSKRIYTRYQKQNKK